MTYTTDPSRWTDSLAEAPDALRAPFAAARNEGPSDLQMKALALKLAALSAGTAAAASAATAKAAASTTAGGGAAAASTGAFSMAKVAVSVALFGATITGAVMWQGKVSVRQGSQQTPVVQVAPVAPNAEVQSAAEQQLESARSSKGALGTPSAIEAAPSSPNEAPVEFEAPEAEGNGVVAAKARVTSPSDEAARSVRSPHVRATSTSRARSSAVEAPAAKSSAAVSVSSAKSTEVDLLRRARAALASRPREAFAITQEHREQYPSGMFAQERDALAIEALMRAGEMGTARTLAERFVREHPSSPHAHRFRETMDLR